MFKWCAYCQKLMGETEPLEVFEFSHGICSECLRNRRWAPEFSASVEKLAQFQRELLQVGRSGDFSQAPRLLKKGLELGVRPLDFLIGFIQPALYKIGSFWEERQISITEEHRFTAFASQLMDLCFQSMGQPERQKSKQVDILLINAPGNYHFLGLKIVEQWLTYEKRQVFTVFPGIPECEIVELASDMKPNYVGVSIAESKQQDLVSGLSQTFSEAASFKKKKPVLLVGGPALRRKEWKTRELDQVYFCKDVFSLKQALASQEPERRIKKAT